ncbi:TetR/AcrR family transcriptional regulator [Pseudomonas syringae]|uniref:TetR/AcrR family transcriptional regulator n=1 Tax=Pseudomonas syringae TaxID=317 RepID=UPI0009B3F65A|nr:TetR/AcrR family transcriptional regulator [Pseudomonas syringae]
METMKKVRMQREQRSSDILDTAEALFLEKGYAATTLKQVAESCKVTRPVIYEHYPDKEELFLACAHRARNQFELELSMVLDNEKDSYEQILYRAADVFFSMLEKNPKRWMMLFGATLASSGTLSEGLSKLRQGTIEKIAAMIYSQFKELADKDSVCMNAYAISGVGEQLGRWWINNPTQPKSLVIEHYVRFVLGGINLTINS